MVFENYPYGIFNINGLQSFDYQMYEVQRKHMEQQKNIADMVKVISDYCNAARKVAPEYRQQAIQACCIELMRQMNRLM